MTVVGRFEFGGRHVAAGLVEPPVVEPVDIVQRGDLDLVSDLGRVPTAVTDEP